MSHYVGVGEPVTLPNGERRSAWQVEVLVDGKPVTNTCLLKLDGDRGWAERYTGAAKGDRLVTEKVHGRVVIRWPDGAEFTG